MFYQHINNKIKQGKKIFALLIDPDKSDSQHVSALLSEAELAPGPDIILVGGSIVFNGIENTIARVKKVTSKPVFLFPGSTLQVAPNADGILLLSLISGRNPEFLIGSQVISAPSIKKSKLEVIPTGYMLINCGADTSVSYMSNTAPIPYHKNDIAIATALAGEMLGLKAIYLEGGSGANRPVSSQMISAVRKNIGIPIIVGGGISTNEQLTQVLHAGADMVVVGTAFENDYYKVKAFASIVSQF